MRALGLRKALLPVAVIALATTATLVSGVASGTPAPQREQRAAGTFPALKLSTAVSGLTQPWDVKLLPHSRILITERETRRLRVKDGGTLRTVKFPSSSVWASGETG